MYIRVIPTDDTIVLRLEQASGVESEVDEAVDAVRRQIVAGHKSIALAFTRASYPYSKLINLIVSCYRRIEENSGKLSVITPTEDFYEILKQTKLTAFIDVVRPGAVDINERKN